MPRKQSEDTLYAKELGFTGKQAYRTIHSLGGASKMRSLSPEARAVLLAPLGMGNSQELHKGGLAARGMRRAKDIRSQ